MGLPYRLKSFIVISEVMQSSPGWSCGPGVSTCPVEPHFNLELSSGLVHIYVAPYKPLLFFGGRLCCSIGLFVVCFLTDEGEYRINMNIATFVLLWLRYEQSSLSLEILIRMKSRIKIQMRYVYKHFILL